jgi:hypothetical protein
VTLPLQPARETLTINGVALDTYALLLTDVSGLMVSPPLRGENTTVAGRHGVLQRPGKRFAAAELVLPLWVNGARPDGSVPSGSAAVEFFQRRDELLQLLHSDPLVLAYTRPGGVTVEGRCELVEALSFARAGVGAEAEVSVALTLLDPFWSDTEDSAQTITSGSPVELTAFAGSTAPIADARITFFGPVNNPRLAIGSRYVQFNGVIGEGRELLLDCGHWRASSGAGDDWSPPVTQIYREPGPAWLEISPSSGPLMATFTHSGSGSASVEIAGRRKFLTI